MVPAVALDRPASKRLRVTFSSSTDDHASMAGDGIPSASILTTDAADFRMRGEEHLGVEFPSHAPQETAESQCRLLHLPGELLSSIVARVAASASCPSDIANLRLSCRTMRATAHAPATLAAASSAAVEVRLRQWCPHAHQFLRECEAGNAPACHFLGMGDTVRDSLSREDLAAVLQGTRAILFHPPHSCSSAGACRTRTVRSPPPLVPALSSSHLSHCPPPPSPQGGATRGSMSREDLAAVVAAALAVLPPCQHRRIIEHHGPSRAILYPLSPSALPHTSPLPRFPPVFISLIAPFLSLLY
ncbi:unnamed protein product [Closterium sp. Naga37s-1]|nr:unnamed protein product [Closterium sp. Naga37s-1]